MAKPHLIETRDRYRIFDPVTTRWADNDAFGHINNAVYNVWMDTAITQFFRRHWPGLPSDTDTIPVAAETMMTFHRSICHPADVETGLRVDRVGNRSVHCAVGIFVEEQAEAMAWGHMIHVWVDRVSNRAVPIPEAVRTALQTMTIP